MGEMQLLLALELLEKRVHQLTSDVAVLKDHVKRLEERGQPVQRPYMPAPFGPPTHRPDRSVVIGPGLRERHVDPFERVRSKPSDDGAEVTDGNGKVVGRRGYTSLPADPDHLIPVTYRADGSRVIHFGGPVGDAYLDENGDM